MARQPRIEYEGAIYHVMNRGDRRELIVSYDEDRQLFAKTLAEACEGGKRVVPEYLQPVFLQKR